VSPPSTALQTPLQVALLEQPVPQDLEEYSRYALMVEELCEGWGVESEPVLNQVVTPPRRPAGATSLPPTIGNAVIADLVASGRWTMGKLVRGTLFQDGPRSEVTLTVTVPIPVEEGDRILSEYLTDRSVSPWEAERETGDVENQEWF
jgi:hypothetical protein